MQQAVYYNDIMDGSKITPKSEYKFVLRTVAPHTHFHVGVS